MPDACRVKKLRRPDQTRQTSSAWGGTDTVCSAHALLRSPPRLACFDVCLLPVQGRSRTGCRSPLQQQAPARQKRARACKARANCWETSCMRRTSSHVQTDGPMRERGRLRLQLGSATQPEEGRQTRRGESRREGGTPHDKPDTPEQRSFILNEQAAEAACARTAADAFCVPDFVRSVQGRANELSAPSSIARNLH
jgi:hypothetical protein